MAVPADVVDAWTWPDGWKVVRPTTSAEIRTMREEVLGRGYNDRSGVGTNGTCERTSFVVAPDGSVVLPILLRENGPAETLLEIVTIDPSFRLADLRTPEVKGRLAEGFRRATGMISSFSDRVVFQNDEVDVRRMFYNGSTSDLAVSRFKAMLRGEPVEDPGSPTPAGEIALILGGIPPELLASLDDLVG